MWHKKYNNLFDVDYENVSSSILDETYEGITNLQSGICGYYSL